MICKALENMLIRCIIHHCLSLLLRSADQYSLPFFGISVLSNCGFTPDFVYTFSFNFCFIFFCGGMNVLLVGSLNGLSCRTLGRLLLRAS